MEKNEILAATRHLKDELPQLMGDQAEPLQRSLDRMIADVASGKAHPRVILIEINRYPAARHRLAEHLKPLQLEFLLGVEEAAVFQPLPGQGTAIGSDEYVCPEPGCPERWHRRKAGQRPPLCKKHQKQLVPKP